MGYRLARIFILFLFRVLTRLEIEGLENVPKEGAAIVVSNHLGRLDPALLYYALDRKDVTLLAAEKYQKYAIFRWFARQLDAIWIDRFNADFAAMRVALQKLKQGYVLAVAPEGTRSKSEVLLEARPGVSYLAAKSGVRIVPVAVTGTEDRLILDQFRHLKRPTIKARVGKPFILPPLKGEDREAALARDTDEIMCQIAALLPAKYHGFYANHPRLHELMEARS